MKLIIVTSLLLTSISCNAFPKAPVVERCVITFQFNKCRCHKFKADNAPGERIVGDSLDHSLEYCDLGVLFKSQPDGPWAKLSSWLDEIYYYLEDKEN